MIIPERDAATGPQEFGVKNPPKSVQLHPFWSLSVTAKELQPKAPVQSKEND